MGRYQSEEEIILKSNLNERQLRSLAKKYNISQSVINNVTVYDKEEVELAIESENNSPKRYWTNNTLFLNGFVFVACFAAAVILF